MSSSRARGLLVGRPLGNQTESGDAARIDHPFDTGIECRSHQDAGPLDIRAEHRRGIGHPEAIIGGNVEQIPATGDGARERLRVVQRALGDFDGKIGEVAPIALRAGQDANVMARLQQRARHGRTDEPGRSGDEAQARCGHCRFTACRFSRLRLASREPGGPRRVEGVTAMPPPGAPLAAARARAACALSVSPSTS